MALGLYKKEVRLSRSHVGDTITRSKTGKEQDEDVHAFGGGYTSSIVLHVMLNICS